MLYLTQVGRINTCVNILGMYQNFLNLGKIEKYNSKFRGLVGSYILLVMIPSHLIGLVILQGADLDVSHVTLWRHHHFFSH